MTSYLTGTKCNCILASCIMFSVSGTLYGNRALPCDYRRQRYAIEQADCVVYLATGTIMPATSSHVLLIQLRCRADRTIVNNVDLCINIHHRVIGDYITPKNVPTAAEQRAFSSNHTSPIIPIHPRIAPTKGNIERAMWSRLQVTTSSCARRNSITPP